MDTEEDRPEKADIYIDIPRSTIEDTVNDNYVFYLTQEVTELSNEFCKYYRATHTTTNEEYYAIIYNNKFLHPLRDIEKLSKAKIANLNSIISYAIVKLSLTKEDRLVVIVDKYDPSDNLANFISKGKTIDNAQFEEIADKIIETLDRLKSLNIYCYDINTSNILMKNGEFLALKEFINSYPNFYQDNQYLAPEIVECHPAARYVENNLGDIYAFAVTMYEAYTGKSYWNDYGNTQDYNYARFENTTSKFLLSKVRLTEKFRVFFKWTLHDEANLRWGSENIRDWIDGKITKMTHESISENKNTIAFNDNNYSNAKSICYALFRNWQEAGKFIRDNKLFKWASRQEISGENLEQIKSMIDIKQDSSFIVTSSANSQVKIPKLLSLLDPNGPLRHENIAFTAASIPIFIHFLTSNNKRDIAEHVLKLAKEEVWLLYSKNPYAAGHLNDKKIENFKRQTSNIGIAVKNLDKLTYLLNPDTYCNSNIVNGKYILTLKELMIALDEYADKARNLKFNIDRNIISFIAARLGIKEELRSNILSNFPKFADHPTLNGLNALNILQQQEPDINISNICQAFVKDLKELFQDYLHNVEFKKKIFFQLDEVAALGKLSEIIHIVSNQQQFINDYNGYYEACRQLKIIEQNIKLISNEDAIYNSSLLLGQKATVLLSYIMCFIVTIAVII